MAYSAETSCEVETIHTLEDYYLAYPDAERIDSIQSVTGAFGQLAAMHTIQVLEAPEDPSVGLMTLSYRPLPQYT